MEVTERKNRERKRGIKNGMLGNYDSMKLEFRACTCVHKCEQELTNQKSNWKG